MSWTVVLMLFFCSVMIAGQCSPLEAGGAKWRNLTARPDHVYVVIYATHEGKTGHAGIAVDKYEVKIRDCSNCPGRVQLDTVKTGELIYFDLWPKEDRFNKQRFFEEVTAQYYRLPASSAEPIITVRSLVTKGIPHEEGYACDGLVKIPSTITEDRELVQYMDQLIDQQRNFDAVHFNCSDFVEQGLEHLLNLDIEADEWILFNKATTPNYLYKAVEKIPGAIILKKPGNRVDGSFLKERLGMARE